MACPVCRLTSISGRAALCLLLAVWSAEVQAELPSIRFDRLHPLGVAAGGAVEVEVSGRDTEDVTILVFDQPGLQAELIKPGRFRIRAGADVPEGTYDVRLSGRYGVSNPRLLAVGHGFAEVLEVEPNNSAQQAQVIALNSAVYGTCDGNGTDVYRFAARRDERIIVDCQAQQLDSALDGTLLLSAAGGQLLATSGDYHGRDPFIDFVAPTEGEYTIALHDLSYRGGLPYRLVVTNRPQVENVFPRAVEPGRTVELQALGRNLQTGVLAPASGGGPALEVRRFPFTMPDAATVVGRYVFREHPTGHSVLPTAATCTLDGMQIRVPVAGREALHAIPLLAATGPVTEEAEPNPDKQHPQLVSVPALVSGRFDQPRDADWYAFVAAEGGNYVFEVFSERIAGNSDPYLVVLDDQDNTVLELDDFGHRINAFDGHLRDPYGTTSLLAGKTYRVLVQDRYGRGGDRFQYVLAIRRPAPDVHVAAIHSENPGPAGTNLWRGGAASLDLVVHQQDGFDSPLTITAEGLPTGVHCAPTTINNDTRGTLVLWSDPEAPRQDVSIRLWASGMVGDKPFRREVRPTTRVWTEPNLSASQPTRELVIGVRDLAPYALQLSPERLEVTAGTKARLKVVATRLWPEFQEKITVIPLGFPGGFSFGSVEIPAGQSEAVLEIDVQANSRPGNYTLSVLGQAQVPYSKDAAAPQKPPTLVSMPSRPTSLTIAAAKK